jgi:hypothetical protein
MWGKKKRFASIYSGNGHRERGRSIGFLKCTLRLIALSLLECHGCLLLAFMLLFYRFGRWWWQSCGRLKVLAGGENDKKTTTIVPDASENYQNVSF